jgi:hypothetical protein
VVTLATADLADDTNDGEFIDVITDIAEAYQSRGQGTEKSSMAIVKGCLARDSSIRPTAHLLPDWEFVRPPRARTFSTGGDLDVARWAVPRAAAKELMDMVRDGLPLPNEHKLKPHQTLEEAKRVLMGYEDEPSNGQPDMYDGCDDKTSRMTKAQRKRLELAENRRVYHEYTANDATSAVQISEEDMAGTQPLNFYGPLLEGGVVDIHHPTIPADLRKHRTALETVKRLNLQLEPTATGVDDKRFKVTESSLAQMVAAILKANSKWARTANLLEKFIIDKDNMVPEDRQQLKNDLRVLVNEAKGLANVVGLTVNALAVPRNRDNLGDFDLGPDRFNKVSLYLPHFIAQLGHRGSIRKSPLY